MMKSMMIRYKQQVDARKFPYDKLVVSLREPLARHGQPMGFLTRTFSSAWPTYGFPYEKPEASNRGRTFSQLGTYFHGLTNLCSSAHEPMFIGTRTYVLRMFLFVMLMVMGVNVWGQTDYSGVYYIGSHGYNANNPNSNYYLCPTEGWIFYKPTNDWSTDGTTYPNPFLTTFKCKTNDYHSGDASTAVWIVEKDPDSDYYYIIQAITGKYMVSNGQISGATANRMRVHLEAVTEGNLDDKELFSLTPYSTYLVISPKSEAGWNNNQTVNNDKLKWYTVNGGNKDYLVGNGSNGGPGSYGATGGILGVYSKQDVNADFYLEPTLLPSPTINSNFNEENNNFSVTIAFGDNLPAGYEILYTTNGDTPANGGATTSTYTGSVTITDDCTIKAVVSRNGRILTEVASKFVGKPAPPTITPPSDCNNIVEISAGDGISIYYTLDGTPPDNNSTPYTGSFVLNEVATIKAIAYSGNIHSNISTYNHTSPYTVKPTITQSGATITISGTGSLYYTTDGSEPDTGSTPYSNPFTLTGNSGDVITVKAVAKDGSKGLSCVAEKAVTMARYISNLNELEEISSHPSDVCILTADIDASGLSESISGFTGTFDGDFYTISGLKKPLFNNVNGATIKNVILKDVNISGDANVGAICNEATGDSRIYNCGVLGTLTETKDDYGNVTNITSTSTISGSGNVGSIVGLLDGTSRVINCYSYATVSGGTMAAGIVGNNNQASTQGDLKTIAVNCMFYGDIKGGSAQYPVYGGNSINNDAADGINPYCYFRKNATFTPTAYNRSWPAEEKNLTRFEYYRSVLNSNRKLCTWWVNGTDGTAPTDEDVSDVGIAKWVLDPAIAPYPILKPWGKYPSVINIDTNNPDFRDTYGPKRFDPDTKTWVSRHTANEWEGKSYGTISVTINAGAHGSGSASRDITITDMDTLNCDYGYYKIQLPYYNEVFGNPDGATHAAKYAGNYTDYVVTGWEISDGSNAVNYNFADRNSYNGRIFAQGGFFYVPKNVSSITITAHWGKAVYLTNRGYSIDRVNVTAGGYRNAGKTEANNFSPAGTVSNTFEGHTVYDDLQTAISNLGSSSDYPTVYDQAIVLIGNHQVKNGSQGVAGAANNWHPFTIMSADFDFDNEPDYCLQLQFREGVDRPGIQPIRFDFLPVIELGLAVRHNNLAYAIGIFIPQGHFEITETSFMRTTQFEWDSRNITKMDTGPVILNGGEFEQIAVRYENGNRTNYFLLGGHLWFHRFAPGFHPNRGNDNNPTIRLCPVNVIGGDYPEFYLSGLYRPDKPASADQGDPICYISGGHFGTIHGSGYDKITGNVTFKIDHAVIGEFYGGGINGSNPIGGNIDVTIDNSRVDKYCGGPEVGDMTGKTVTTHATGTTFGVFYGGGNGGNSYYRQLQFDGDQSSSNIGNWNTNGNSTYNWGGFNPLGVYDDNTAAENKGYHAEYEFEVFNQSNGVADQITQRGFIKWLQFGITITGNVSNTLSDCKILNNFYGGGNLATVDGTVTSTLTNTVVDGSAFGAGYSAAIPTFQVHDKSTASFPSITAGVITDGHIDHNSNVYEWTNDLNGKTQKERKADPTYEKDGKWYCYTWNSLDNLGAVLNSASLTINGNSVIGTASDSDTGNVYGGGDASAVDGSTTVTLKGNTKVWGNVFGGGNEGVVSGSTTVNILQ